MMNQQPNILDTIKASQQNPEYQRAMKQLKKKVYEILYTGSIKPNQLVAMGDIAAQIASGKITHQQGTDIAIRLGLANQQDHTNKPNWAWIVTMIGLGSATKQMLQSGELKEQQ